MSEIYRNFKINHIEARMLADAAFYYLKTTKHLDNTDVKLLNSGDLYLIASELKDFAKETMNDLNKVIKENNIPEASDSELNRILFGKNHDK